MSKRLHLARNLDLPIDAVTQAIGILGRRGSGKTNLAGVFVEELLEVGAQAIVLDPVGNYWGLRLAGDGKGRGYDIPVLGGDRGDVPIEPGAGALIADLVVEKELSAVVDVSRFRKGERKQFVTAFAEQLFHRKKSAPSPVHVVLEEAQLVAPQHAPSGEARMLGAIEDLVRLGRNYGIGCTLITQRPQSVAKNVLSQVEVLVVLQLTSPQERKAVLGWVVNQGVDVAALVDELPGLKRGTGYLWSPQWLEVLGKYHFRKKRTYDASATPTLGQKPVSPRRLEAGEVDELRGAMADVVQRAEENDPKLLRRRVRELEQERARGAEAGAAPDPQALERARAEGAADAERRLREVVARVEARDRAVADVLRGAHVGAGKALELLSEPIDVELASIPAKSRALERTSPGTGTRPLPVSRPRMRSENDKARRSSGERRMLEVLAQHHPQGLRVGQWAVLAHLKRSGGTWATYLSRLRTRGQIEERGGFWYATAAGVEAAGVVPDLPRSTDEVIEMWRGKPGMGPVMRLVEVAVDHPRGLHRAALAEAVGLEGSGGTFSTYLSRAKTAGLLEVDGGIVRPAEALFP